MEATVDLRLPVNVSTEEVMADIENFDNTTIAKLNEEAAGIETEAAEQEAQLNTLRQELERVNNICNNELTQTEANGRWPTSTTAEHAERVREALAAKL
ncbi:hypothetical protein H2203_007221 [Taxawa tesnikishii (nom. ined.)]|nr:hypothetical protein H2203_007221 [Dothideales sp. JES 119]